MVSAKPQFLNIELSKIDQNPDNPRGPNVRENDPHRESLKESIARFGILVPLVVRRKGQDSYELIDGERRFWVAQSLRLREVPAYVFDGPFDRRAILQRMFQIHTNRDPWDPVQQCEAAEPYYAELVHKHGDDTDAIIRDFAKFSGTDLRTARNRIQFLRWPSTVKQPIYDEPRKHPSYWYVVEIEDKIVEPALKNYPEYFDRVSPDVVRAFLYRKWEKKTIKAAVEVRRATVMVRDRMKGATERKKVVRLLDRLVNEIDFTYDDAFEEFVQEFPALREPRLPKPGALLGLVRRLSGVLADYELQYFEAYGGRKKPKLDELLDGVRDLLESGRKFLRKMKS